MKLSFVKNYFFVSITFMYAYYRHRNKNYKTLSHDANNKHPLYSIHYSKHLLIFFSYFKFSVLICSHISMKCFLFTAAECNRNALNEKANAELDLSILIDSKKVQSSQKKDLLITW